MQAALRPVLLCSSPQRRVESRHDGAAARLLRQQRELHAAGQLLHQGARIDVGRSGIERLARRHRRRAFVVLDQRGDVGRRRNFGAVRMRRRHEHAQRAVGGLEVLQRNPLHVLALHLAQAVAVKKEQTPVAHADEIGQRDTEFARIGHGHVDLVQQLRARAFHLLVGDRIGGEALQGRDQRRARGIQGQVLAQAGAEIRVSGFAQLFVAAVDGARLAGLDQRALQPPPGHLGERGDQDVDRRKIGMRARRQVVQGADELHLARAAQGDAALAVLGRFDGVGGDELARRAWAERRNRVR